MRSTAGTGHTVRLDKNLKRALRKAARDRDLSMGEVIREAVRRYIGDGADPWYEKSAESDLRKYLAGVTDADELRDALAKEARLRDQLDLAKLDKIERQIDRLQKSVHGGSDRVEKIVEKILRKVLPGYRASTRDLGSASDDSGSAAWNSETMTEGEPEYAPDGTRNHSLIGDSARDEMLCSLGLPPTGAKPNGEPDVTEEGDADLEEKNVVEQAVTKLAKALGVDGEALLGKRFQIGAMPVIDLEKGLKSLGIETDELRKDAPGYTPRDHAAPAFVLTDNGLRPEPLSKNYKTSADRDANVRSPRVVSRAPWAHVNDHANTNDVLEKSFKNVNLKKMARAIADGDTDAVEAMFSRLRRATLKNSE